MNFILLSGRATKKQVFKPSIQLLDPANPVCAKFGSGMKLTKTISTYWWCQIAGWSLFVLVYLFFFITLSTVNVLQVFQVLCVEALLGLIVTHAMRVLIRRYEMTEKPINEQVVLIFCLTTVFSIIYATAGASVEHYLNIEPASQRQYNLSIKIFRLLFSCFTLILIWMLIYFGYHYINRTRQEKFDKIRLQTLVKELELKTIKSHINPHFIFNALNSIRAMIDENPGRARNAITELSNILRSSMQAEKLETVPLEKELDIVKDYLALEYMRFEERLSIHYDIDPDTLRLPIPPMMLQTLVENAIKHGISKQVNGGVVKISTRLMENGYELKILNTGTFLTDSTEGEGFGLASTKNRLYYLFGEKACFTIVQKTPELVEATLIIPQTK